MAQSGAICQQREVQGNPASNIGKSISTSPTPAPGRQRRGLFFEEKSDADQAATEDSHTPESGSGVLEELPTRGTHQPEMGERR